MRYHLVKITIALAMAAGMLLSQKLWLTERYYPHVPVWDGLPNIPAPWDKVIFYGMLTLLGLVVVSPWPRWPLLGFVVLAGTWSLWDQSRWQPWFYQYLFMLAALGFGGRRDPDRRAASLNACRFILAATYIWSGVQKISLGFATDMFPYLMEPIAKHMSDPMRVWLNDQGWYAAFIEGTLGLMLLLWPLRPLAAGSLMLMHAIILYCLGPRGHDWNTVVWPWNGAMIALNLMLFVNTPKLLPWHIVWPRRFVFARVTLILFGIMPLFSFYGWWDAYLSAALYSGNTIDGHIYVNEDLAATLPTVVAEKNLRDNYLFLFGWSMDEMNVPDYPARRVYRGIARKLRVLPDSVVLDVEESPDWRTGKRVTTREKLDE